MRPIEDLKDCGNSSLVVALTGDGKLEKKILRALAQRHDGHDKALLLPTKASPIGAERRRTGRFSGLSAFQVIKTYVGKYRFSQYLFLLDIEHFSGNRTQEGLQSEISKALNGFGFADQNITQLNDHAYRVRCTLGLHRVRINTVLSGSDRRVEENISELLKLEHGLDIAPDKGAIQRALEQLGSNLHALLTSCCASNLSRAFSGLVAALQDFENHNPL